MVVPEVTGRRDTLVEESSQALALRALAPTTTFHLPAAPARTVQKLMRLVRSAGCYRLLAGTDLKQIPEALANLVERLNEEAA